MASRERLIEIVRRIIEAGETEEEIDALITEFVNSVPHPAALDVLGKHDDPESIVDEALAYRLIPMPGSWTAGSH